MITIVILCAIVANIIGIALHYTHKPNTKSIFVHFVSAVNESTWEHLKLAFMPMLFLCFVQTIILRNDYPNILEASLFGAICTMILIPLIYYPVRFILKKEVVLLSIGIFILSVSLGYFVEFLLISNTTTFISESVALIIGIVIFVLFALFTFYPPKIFLFRDPTNNRYGHINT